MARLIIFDDSVRGVDLPDRAVIVGRSLKADIPIHDRLLSRKHCTLMREGRSYRLLDLRSANGSFVNGVRVEKADLEYDDVIEIGSTVMVLLESDTWERGEGLARLRNPLKAQELIQRLRRHASSGLDGREDGHGDGAARAGAENRRGGVGALRDREPFERESPWTTDVLREVGLAPELLEEFLMSRIVALLVRRTPELRECLSDAMERVLTPESFHGGFERFRLLVGEAIRTSLEEAGLARSASAGGTASLDEPDPAEPTPRGEPRVVTDHAAAGSEDGPH